MAVMNRMRENMKTILIILVVAFMLTIIIDWGMGGFKLGHKQGVIGVVNGTEITVEQFNNILSREIDSQRDRTGSEPGGRQRTQIEDQVWDQIVQMTLLEQKVRQDNVVATNEEILYYIKNDPPEFLKQNQAFQDSLGNFNMQAYQQALANPGADPFWIQVENYLRSTLPYQKLQEMLEVSVNVSDLRVRKEFEKRYLKASADYVLFDANKFSKDGIKISDKEIESRYNKNKQDYHEAEKRKIDYAFFEFKATPNDSASVRNFAKELLDRAKEGEDFAELAKTNSEDKGSATRGGDLGFFARGAMVKEFEEAAFSARPGEIVGPVESNFGIHIIKVEEFKKEGGEQKVKARHILLKYKASRETRDIIQEDAQYLAQQAKQYGLKQAAAVESTKVQTTGFFTEGATIPGIGLHRRAMYSIFHNKVGHVEGPFYTEKGYFVLEIAGIQKERIKPLEVVKKQIENNILNEKRKELALKQAESFYKKTSSDKPFDEIAREDSLEIKSVKDIRYGGFVPGIGREPAFVGAMFGLEIGEISRPIEGKRGYFVLQVTQRDSLNQKDFESQKKVIREQLMRQQKQSIFRTWYDGVKKEAKIEDFRGLYL